MVARIGKIKHMAVRAQVLLHACGKGYCKFYIVPQSLQPTYEKDNISHKMIMYTTCFTLCEPYLRFKVANFVLIWVDLVRF